MRIENWSPAPDKPNRRGERKYRMVLIYLGM